MPNDLPLNLLSDLKNIFSEKSWSSDPSDCVAYSYDNSKYKTLPKAVAFPENESQISKLVYLARKYKIPLTARGRGTGTTAASVPIDGGIVVSLERMDKILNIDPHNRIAIVEPGVLNQTLQNAVKPFGFFWPPDPTSSAICTVGGNLACNAAGPRAVKYGTSRENTLGLNVVIGTGEILTLGVKTTKGVVGYDLTRLLIGSEGTLGIISKATLKLTPLPDSKRTIRALYINIETAAEAVSAIMGQPITPCALEFIDDTAVNIIRKTMGNVLPEEANALLMIEVDGPEEFIDSLAASVTNAAHNSGLIDIHSAKTPEETKQLWAARKSLSPALRKIAPKKINEDVVVPVSNIPDLISGLHNLSKKYDITIVNFGHAGNGNIHVNLLFDHNDPHQNHNAQICLNEIFTLVLKLDGTLSGEHGIGFVKREYVKKEISESSLITMHGIKRVFDPDNILNPHKTIP